MTSVDDVIENVTSLLKRELTADKGAALAKVYQNQSLGANYTDEESPVQNWDVARGIRFCIQNYLAEICIAACRVINFQR